MRSSTDRYNRPISTGTNAMYGRMLRELGTFYHRPDWLEAAARIGRVLDEVTAIRDSGELTYLIADAFAMDPATGRITPADAFSEGSQYVTAFCCDLERRKLPNYFKRLFERFGYAPAEPFNNDVVRTLRTELLVGMMMRFELLHRHGKFAFLEREIKALYSHMIDHGPGTLWEGWSRWSNLTHGYQSYAGAIIMRSFLGLEWIDETARTVTIAPHPADLRWARGFTTAKNGRMVSVDWRLDEDEFTLRVAVPEGYRAELVLPDEIRGWALRLNGRKLKRDTTRRTVSGGVVLSARRNAED